MSDAARARIRAWFNWSQLSAFMQRHPCESSPPADTEVRFIVLGYDVSPCILREGPFYAACILRRDRREALVLTENGWEHDVVFLDDVHETREEAEAWLAWQRLVR